MSEHKPVNLQNALSYRVNPEEDTKSTRFPVGLCASCANARRVESARGAVFYLCELSALDSRFPKYPRLPVQECPGYAQVRSA